MKLLSAGQVREWDAYTIANEPISSIELMERAALQCTEWIVQHSLFNQPLKIFCGKGNNGGDGLAIARQLIQRDVHPEVYILEFGSKGSEDFQANLQQLHRLTKNIFFIQSSELFPEISHTDVVTDALFGSGLNRPLDGLSASLVNHINASGATVISIDVPSGMFIDRSSKGNTVVCADHTLTFQSMKLCLLAAENAADFGIVSVLDIGLSAAFPDTVVSPYYLTDHHSASAVYRPRDAFAHKGHFGHALIIGGAADKTGAAIIAAEACLRSGAGLTSVHLLSDEYTAINSRCPEVMTLPGDALVKKNLSRFNAIGIGPGLGIDDIAIHLVSLVMEHHQGGLVIDADGLNVLAAQPGWLMSLPRGTILTPHPKEFDRLFSEHRNEFERYTKALEVSEQHGIVIVLKGHHTLVAAGGQGYFNMSGNAGLAKGGSGDTLTGIITALVAQQYSAFDAALLGVYIHGLAADLATTAQSFESLIASDVCGHLGKAFGKLANLG